MCIRDSSRNTLNLNMDSGDCDQDTPALVFTTKHNVRVNKNDVYNSLIDTKPPLNCHIPSFLRIAFPDQIKRMAINVDLLKRLTVFLQKGYACQFSEQSYRLCLPHECAYCDKFSPVPIVEACRLLTNHLIIAENNIFLAVRHYQYIVLYNVLRNSGIDAFLREERWFYDCYESFNEYLFQLVQSGIIPTAMIARVYEGTVFRRVVMIGERKRPIPSFSCARKTDLDANVRHMLERGGDDDEDDHPHYLSLLNWDSALLKSRKAGGKQKRFIGRRTSSSLHDWAPKEDVRVITEMCNNISKEKYIVKRVFKRICEYVKDCLLYTSIRSVITF